MEAARRATGADHGDIADLATAAIEELRPLRGGEIWVRRHSRGAEVASTLIHDLEDDRTLVVVGTIDDVVVGYAVARLEALDDGEDVSVVSDLYVTPEARGVGVGEAMMNLAVEWSRQHRCVGIDSIALPGDRATKNFFETFGLVARAILVHKNLREDR